MTNKTRRMVGAGMAVTAILGTWTVLAESVPVAASADVSVLSAYVWRGQVLSDEGVVQPAMTITKGGFAANVWGNVNLTDGATTPDPDLSEVDLTLSYTKTLGAVTLAGGVIDYSFPNQTLAGDAGGVGYPGTREVYASASLGGCPLTPAVTVYYDFDEVEGVYSVASLTYSTKLADNLTLTASGSLAYGTEDYNAAYFGVADDALNDALVTLSAGYAVTPSLTITPTVQYAWLPDSDIEDAANGLYQDKDQLFGGLKASYTF